MEIKRLSPALCGDYLEFFDTTPHDDNIDAHKCYCVCWSTDNDKARDFSTAEKRRELAELFVREGKLDGYLAYEAGRAIGWLNANSKLDCLESLCGERYLKPLPGIETERGMRIKSIFCFVIAPEFRRRGVATALLERAIEDARADGFSRVEAYPLKAFTSEQYDYVGPAKMYEKLGFTFSHDFGDRLIVRLEL